MEEQLVDEGYLAREDNGDESVGIEVGLGDCVELVEDIEAEQVGLVDEEDGDLLRARDVRVPHDALGPALAGQPNEYPVPIGAALLRPHRDRLRDAAAGGVQ